jgi:hypothetical protein
LLPALKIQFFVRLWSSFLMAAARQSPPSILESSPVFTDRVSFAYLTRIILRVAFGQSRFENCEMVQL